MKGAFPDMKSRLLAGMAVCLLAAVCVSPYVQAQSKPVVTSQAVQEKGASWDFTFRYPNVTVPGSLMGVSAMMRDFNTHMQQDAASSLTAFKAEVADWLKDAANQPQDARSTRDVKYTVLTATTGAISVKFDQYQMMAGAAHPVTTVVTRNFLWGGFVPLSALFTPQSKWLETVSRLVGDDLRKQAKAKSFALMTPQGFGPDEKNFEAFGITRHALNIYLQRDQVAAGYVGNLQVSLPWSALSSTLRPNVRDLIHSL